MLTKPLVGKVNPGETDFNTELFTGPDWICV